MDQITAEADDTVTVLLAQIRDLSLELAIAKAQLAKIMRLVPADVLAAASRGGVEDDSAD